MLVPKKIKIEKFINPAVYFLIICGLILLLGKKTWWPSFYDPIFLGFAFLISAALIVLPKLIFRTDNFCKQQAVILLRFAFSVALILNALGELYLYELYKHGFQYDKLIHFFNCFLLMVVLTSFLETWYNFSFKKALTISIVLVLAGSIVWEVLEFTSDVFLKTTEFGIYGQYKTVDTIFDVLFDILGIIASSYFLQSPKLSKKIIDEYCHWPALDTEEKDNEKL